MTQDYGLYLIDGQKRLVGTVRFFSVHNGYRFIPATCSRKGSTKYWPSAVSCIPRWAEKHVGDHGELLTLEEWKAVRGAVQ